MGEELGVEASACKVTGEPAKTTAFEGCRLNVGVPGSGGATALMVVMLGPAVLTLMRQLMPALGK